MLTLSLKEMILYVLRATSAVNHYDADRIMNWYANELENQVDVKREDLQAVFEYFDIPLWEDEQEEEGPCGHCKDDPATMHNDFTEEGRVCADCYWDIREAFKREKFESSQPPSTQYSSQPSNQPK